MKFPGGMNIQQMMKQAQQMQERMAKEMEEMRVEASAGGGVVTVQMKGTHEVESLKIDPEAVKEGRDYFKAGFPAPISLCLNTLSRSQN
ncbi:MAG: YbaB/EbfC family nucleoid-associated protein [Acidobacteria bacterium]|nr:YbaB/EbfC family nucleoid-associated protein [Acidobacteriota bacterium]